MANMDKAAGKVDIKPHFIILGIAVLAVVGVLLFMFPGTISTLTGSKVVYHLIMSVTPLNSGRVTPLSGNYARGSIVTISAIPIGSNVFVRWIGSGSGSYTGTNQIAKVTMLTNIQEAATFNVVIVTTTRTTTSVTTTVNSIVYGPYGMGQATNIPNMIVADITIDTPNKAWFSETQTSVGGNTVNTVNSITVKYGPYTIGQATNIPGVSVYNIAATYSGNTIVGKWVWLSEK